MRSIGRFLLVIVLGFVCLQLCLDASFCVVFLEEPFDSLAGWDDNTPGTGYDAEIDGGTAYIYGNGYPVKPNISRVVDIAGWQGTVWLELDYRAKSDTSCSVVTNAFVNLLDPATSDKLGSVALVRGGTKDTGWCFSKTDVSDMVEGYSSVVLVLKLVDSWSANWHQQAWFDNVTLYDTSSGGGEMLYGYYNVFDMNMSLYYDVMGNTSWHIANAANQSNAIIVPDRAYYTDPSITYSREYPNLSVSHNLSMILDTHSTFKFFWFDPYWMLQTEPERIDEATLECWDYYFWLGPNNDEVVAVQVFDEPVQGAEGFGTNPDNIGNMRSVVEDVWGDKPAYLNFHRQGDEMAEEFGWFNGVDIEYEVEMDHGVHFYEIDGHRVRPNISSVVDISGWSGSMYLWVDWRAKSDYSGSGDECFCELLRSDDYSSREAGCDCADSGRYQGHGMAARCIRGG